MLVSLCFSTSGADDFRAIVEERWEELRIKPSNPEQAWLIPQPSRNSWGDTREFNKVSLVSQIIGCKPWINNKNDAKCMDKYFREAPESDLVIKKLGMGRIIYLLTMVSGETRINLLCTGRCRGSVSLPMKRYRFSMNGSRDNI